VARATAELLKKAGVSFYDPNIKRVARATSVRKAGSRIRVTAQLINVVNGYHLWSERYDREMTDVFAIQDEISLAIVETLRVRLTADRPLARRHSETWKPTTCT
jgi:hypothetical protein